MKQLTIIFVIIYKRLPIKGEFPLVWERESYALFEFLGVEGE
jgi:hypothetical protein